MLPNVETWMFYRGDGKKVEDELACVTVSAHHVKVVPIISVSRLIRDCIELRDKNGVNFATITWPSTIKARKVAS